MTAGQAYAPFQLSLMQSDTGDYRAAIASKEQALALARGAGDQCAEACAVQMLGAAQNLTSDYAAAAKNLTEALDPYRTMGHRQGEAEVLRSSANCEL